MNLFPDYQLGHFQQELGPYAQLNMGASAPEPISLAELLSMASQEERACWEKLSLDYASSLGADYLREQIAFLYPGLEAKHILTFAGAQEAIFSVYHALLSPGDRLHVIRPLFEPLEIVAVGIGAQVSHTVLEVDKENRWQLDLDAWLEGLSTDAAIATINFPHNPTGMMIGNADRQRIINACQETETWLFSDEVFRGLEHEPGDKLVPVASLYEKGISMGVVSKMFGFGGVRVGWVACQDESLMASLIEIKRFLSICNGQPDELLAAIALRNADPLQLKIVKKLRSNVELIEKHLPSQADRDVLINWIRPQAGCVAYPQIGAQQSGADFAAKLVKHCGVLVVPGNCFLSGEKHFRLGFGRNNFAQAFDGFMDFLEQA